MLGYSSIKQTADTYTHAAPTIHCDAASRFNEILTKYLAED